MTVVTHPSDDLDRHASGHFGAAIDSSGRIALTGELDITRLGALRGILNEALDRSGGPLLVDAGDLSFIDQSAISELLRYQLLAAARQRRLWLNPVSDPVGMLVDVFDLQHILGPMRVVT
jgi:anti-anti-sigma factor